MNHITGYVLAVPKADKQKFVDHGKLTNAIFMEMGALRVIECWEDDVPTGKHTDFRRAVQAKPDEAIVFSWIEWPDKATCDTAMQRMETGDMKDDPRLNPKENPMPFDGTRMIYGSFTPLVTLGD